MRSVETSGKTRKEAIEKALEELGVEMHEVDIDILDEGSRGLFGLLARDVKVKASTSVPGPDKPRREPPQAQRSERGRRERSEQRDERSPRAPRAEKPAPPRERRAEARPPAKTEFDSAESQAHAKEAAALLSETIKRMGIDAAVDAQPAEEGFKLQIESADSAILIGRKGRTLSALQYLLNRMVHADDGDFKERIVVDVGDYLERRQGTLEELAQRMAEKAKSSGRDVRLKPLSPQERRVIHVALENDPDVRTFSIGDDVFRTMVISPKKSDQDARRPRRGGRRSGSRRGTRPSAPESGNESAQDAV